MTPERTELCYTVAVATALSTALGAQLLAGIAGGEVAGALGRELIDLSTYWRLALPVCYLVAGVLGYMGPGAGSSPSLRPSRSTPSWSPTAACRCCHSRSP
jgi:hypothetical protein